MIKQTITVKPNQDAPGHSNIIEEIEGSSTKIVREMVPDVLVNEVIDELKQAHIERYNFAAKEIKRFIND